MGVSAREAISAAKDRLRTAQFGLYDMQKDPSRYKAGLMNAAVFGRMVTLALQNMRKAVDGWEEWYAIWQLRMKNDPVMEFFKELRNKIEKQTAPSLAVSGTASFNSSDIAKFKPKPPGAIAFVMGNAARGGASGWLVSMPDGEEELFAVELPPEIGNFIGHLNEMPAGWEGRSSVDLVEYYINWLSNLVEAAENEFVRRAK